MIIINSHLARVYAPKELSCAQHVIGYLYEKESHLLYNLAFRV